MAFAQRARVLALALGLALSAAYTATSQSSAPQQEVEKAELERLRAVQAGDVGMLDRLYAPEYTATGPNGLVRTKTEILGEFRRAGHGFDQANDEVTVRVYGDTAVVIGRTTQKDPLSVTESRFLRVWVKREGHWQAVAHQSTPISARRRRS